MILGVDTERDGQLLGVFSRSGNSFLMRERKGGRRGWLPAFSLSNYTDGSAIGGDRKDHRGVGRREGSRNRGSVLTRLKNEFVCGKLQAFIKVDHSVTKPHALITLLLSPSSGHVEYISSWSCQEASCVYPSRREARLEMQISDCLAYR